MNNGGGKSAAPAAPTGCYKCGRPGHWSRDCPSNPNQNPDSSNPNSSSNPGFGGSISKPPPSDKPKKVPLARPKLTPELFLSNDGIGYVLRHFPRAFKYRGRGHEVSDLGNLIGLYAEWHSHLIPYYSFDQFVHKVEQVGGTRRVRTCLGGLRERVANGGDPTKLHEAPVEDNSNNNEEAMNVEEPRFIHKDVFMQNQDTDDLQGDMLRGIYNQATDVPCPSELDVTTTTNVTSHDSPTNDLTNQANQACDDTSTISREKQISEEQKARMEANRLKALERTATRARSSKTA